MAPRPTPPPVDPCTKIIRRIMRDGRIDRVEVLARDRGVLVTAHPSSYHPAVAERRTHEIAKRGGSITLAEAEHIGVLCMSPVANGRGPTVLAALEVLEVGLKASGAT